MTSAKQPESKAKRQLFVAAAGATVVLGIVGIWVGVHKVPWLGPRLHEVGVSVFGRTAMGWVERLAYAADAGWNKLWGIDERPEAYWNLPSASASASGSAAPPPLQWAPHSPGPMLHTPFSKGDGLWFPIVESPGEPGAPLVFRLTLHPDGDVADAVVKVAAVDLRRSDVRLMPGKAQGKKARGVLPEGVASRLVAIVAGGRKAPRGGFGLAEGGTVVVRPKATACVIGRAEGGPVVIGFWSQWQTKLAGNDWWRQAPPCPLDQGELQPGFANSRALSGQRVLVGISRDGVTLLVGIASAASVETSVRAMRHAGAWSAAALDTSDGAGNLYYVIEGSDGATRPLMEGSDAGEWTTPSAGDFLYVLRK